MSVSAPHRDRERGRRYAATPSGKERRQIANRDWYERNKAKKAALAREYRRRNRKKTYAHAAVKRALAVGRLQREECLFCDDPNGQAHHHDYSQPLVVTWLCARYHRIVHRTPKEAEVVR